MGPLIMSFHTNLLLQAWAFLSVSLVSNLFGAAIMAQQYMAGVRPAWPMPGGLVGGAFFLWIGVLTLHMSLGRFGILPWRFVSTPATVIYCVVAVGCIATLIRWWRHGFGDPNSERPWDGTERRSGNERRRPWRAS